MAAAAAPSESACMLGVGIIELDVNGDVMMAWSYPSLDTALEPVLISRSGLKAEAPVGVCYANFKGQWHYWATITSGLPNKQLAKVDAFSLHLVTNTFNPERYNALASVLAHSYLTTGEPTKVLEGYLSAFTAGETMGWRSADFGDRPALINGTALALMPRIFGEEVVLIWNAMLLKKRVLVHSENVDDLLQVVRALPQLVWHRQDWKILRPYVTGSEAELADIAEAGVCCAGTTDAALRARGDLYDLYVDVGGRSVVVSEHAKADFALGAFHRDVAALLVSAAGAEGASAQSMIKAVAVKTKELIAQVKSLSSDGGATVSVDDIKAKGMPVPVQRFCYSVAAAEGFAKA